MTTPSAGAWLRAARGAATTTPTATAATSAWLAQLRSEGRFISSSRNRRPPYEGPHGSMSRRTDGYIPVRSDSREVNEATSVDSGQVRGEREDRRDTRPVDAGIAIVALVVVAAAALRPLLNHLLDRPAIAHWATVFVAIAVQAMPFLVLGVVISAAVAAFVPAGFLPRALPRRPALAVPAAARRAGAAPGGAGVHGAARPAAGRRVPDRGGGDRRHAPDGGAAQHPGRRGRGGSTGAAGAGRTGGGDGDLLGGGRLRGRQPHPVLADRPAGVHGGRPDGRREAHRLAGRDLRPPLRAAVRAADAGGRAGLQRCRRAVAAVSAAGGLISLLVGTALLRLVVTGTYGRYVRVGMGPWLAIAGVAVIVLGLVTLVREARRGERGAPEGSGEPRAGAPVAPLDGHDHGGGNRMGWLLLAPIAALLLVAPPTLGSFGVDRGTQVNVRAGGAVLAPLRP